MSLSCIVCVVIDGEPWKKNIPGGGYNYHLFSAPHEVQKNFKHIHVCLFLCLMAYQPSWSI